ncbi:zinc-dependent MarR family transcriptional regulator [Streptococcus sp. CSL10205-OR2]|uniref:zinc-dependent MarR family transcriptional regulator n=1 Tax=Streptococcus sp. CSL10205-OR2 TaxID=2980558 RepID=UPI0021DA3EE6|nr:zinc-dependent MarR family transcriptional regulator [Streptococcus sp. CSL10205-OR2]MCU9534020.1 zinc-dependent MarR family transcriptional regulator [Streptococcus sp. CSL10205-OR2]
MKHLSERIDKAINKILLFSENQHELLLGTCQSDIKLTNTQEHILMLLADEQLTNSDLAIRLKISQAAVTKAIKGLVKQGMLASSKNKEDARITYFELTELAKPIAVEHQLHHNKTLSFYDHLLEEFSEDEQLVIEKFLDQLSDTLEREK